MNKYEEAHRRSMQTWISGPMSVAQHRIRGQAKERRAVIRMWNEGTSLLEIAFLIKRTPHYVARYLERFEYFYGREAVEKRRIPFEMPEEDS